MNDKPTVGITFFLREKESIWNNGGAQNCVFLLRLLRASGLVGRVLAVNAGEASAPHPGLMLEKLGIEFVPIEQAVEQVDVLIEMAAQVSAQQVQRVHDRGGKAITYKFGNTYVIELERAIHKKSTGAIINGTKFDEVWTTPQHMHTCGSYWEAIYRCPVRCLPHIWMPTFVELAASELSTSPREIDLPSAWDGSRELMFGYKARAGAKRIGIFEPNANLIKTSIVPLLACELVYREQGKSAIDSVMVTNTLHLKGHLTFRKLVGSLDIVRDAVASFEARYNTPWMLAKHCDIVVSHQWENGLNYAYYDALHGGYPLIHNTRLLPDGVGYRYDGFDAHHAARVLLDVIRHHDTHRFEYEARAHAFLETVHALHPTNVATHEHALLSVLNSHP